MNGRLLLLCSVAFAALAAMAFVDPIAQDPGYHLFADGASRLGIPNFWNVATNLPFLAVGAAGLLHVRQAVQPLHFVVYCAGVALVAVGSGWYHLAPSDPALVFDRLPMTVAFMALFSAVIGDRVSPALGRSTLWPLVAIGIGSIGWWHWTEQAGAGDLRAYALVQFLPMILIPLMLALFPGRGLRARWLWSGLGAYAAAKVAEYFDAAILAATGVLGGHGVKHLLAALAAWWIVRAFLQMSPARAL